MQVLSKQEEKRVLLQMAKEFLESRLGIKATRRNVVRFAKCIYQFEKEIEKRRRLTVCVD